MSYVVIGLGAQGKAVLRYLVTYGACPVYVCDPYVNLKEVDRLKGLLPDFNKWEHVSDLQQLHRFGLLLDETVVIDCSPLSEPKHYPTRGYINLGGSAGLTAKLIAQGRLPGNTTVLDCGIAPGLVSTLATHYLNRGHTDVQIYCGGLPMYPSGQLGYIRTFCTKGLVREYKGLATFREKGGLVKRPALSGREYVSIDGYGLLEAEVTSGGLSLTPERYPNFTTLTYKTLRYAGHWDYIKEHVMPQGDGAASMFEQLLEPVSRANPDIILLAAKYGPFKKQFDVWKWEYDMVGDVSAMAQATGYTAAAVATMIADGLLDRGVIHMDQIDFEDLVARIKFAPEQMRKIA